MTKRWNTWGKIFPHYLIISMTALTCLMSINSHAIQTLDIEKKQKRFDKDWSYYSAEEVDHYTQQREYKRKTNDIFALRQAKLGLINGDLVYSRFFLSKINTSRSKLSLIQKRYQAIVHFIRGEYRESYEILEDRKFDLLSNYKDVCLLKVINLIALDKIEEFRTHLSKCQEVTQQYSQSDQFWLTQVSKIKEKDEQILRGNLIKRLKTALSVPQYTRAWMKLALFLNREKVIIDNIAEVSPQSFQSAQVRELIGLAYYRLGEVKKAADFIEDLETPNADNIRGSINLMQKKYELAFGHFKLALQKKNNSSNALERAIPLAYLLGLWDEGIKMLGRIVHTNLDERKKLALETLFYIRKGELKKAQHYLEVLNKLFQNKLPKEVRLMDSYVALKLGNNERLKEMSDVNCKQGSGLNCWLELQTIHWENIGLTLKRDGPTVASGEIDLSELKKKADIIPLEESIIIDQKDIEELDSSEIKLLP